METSFCHQGGERRSKKDGGAEGETPLRHQALRPGCGEVRVADVQTPFVSWPPSIGVP